MPENYIRTETENGNISISEEVIATIVSTALKEVAGVSDVANSVGTEIMDLIGKRSISKGVKVTVDDKKITVDVLIVVAFGCVVTTVAKNAQIAIITALEDMTGLEPVINVHVSGVSFKTTGEKK